MRQNYGAGRNRELARARAYFEGLTRAYSVRVINLSHPIEPDFAALPRNPSVEILTSEIDGSRHPVAKLSIELHSGTCIEAPFHFFEGKLTIDKVPLERCLGMTTIVHLPHHGAFSEITAEDVAPFADSIWKTKRVLFYTGWHKLWKTESYFTDHPALSESCAMFLLNCGVVLVGVDFPSVDRYPFPVHIALLGREVVIIENLANYEFLSRDTVDLIAIPLEIVGQSGSPVRALAIEKDDTD